MPADVGTLTQPELNMACNSDFLRKGTLFVGIQDMVIGMASLCVLLNTIVVEHIMFPMFGQYLNGNDEYYGFLTPSNRVDYYAKLNNISQNPYKLQYIYVALICLTSGLTLGSIIVILGSVLKRTWLLKCWLYPNYTLITAQAIVLIGCAAKYSVSHWALVAGPTLAYRLILVWLVRAYQGVLHVKLESHHAPHDAENPVECQASYEEPCACSSPKSKKIGMLRRVPFLSWCWNKVKKTRKYEVEQILEPNPAAESQPVPVNSMEPRTRAAYKPQLPPPNFARPQEQQVILNDIYMRTAREASMETGHEEGNTPEVPLSPEDLSTPEEQQALFEYFAMQSAAAANRPPQPFSTTSSLQEASTSLHVTGIQSARATSTEPGIEAVDRPQRPREDERLIRQRQHEILAIINDLRASSAARQRRRELEQDFLRTEDQGIRVTGSGINDIFDEQLAVGTENDGIRVMGSAFYEEFDEQPVVATEDDGIRVSGYDINEVFDEQPDVATEDDGIRVTGSNDTESTNDSDNDEYESAPEGPD